MDFELVFGGLQSPFRCLSAIFKLLEAAGQLLQLGGALMEPLAQFVHPSVQLSLLIPYLQKSHIDFILLVNQISEIYKRIFIQVKKKKL